MYQSALNLILNRLILIANVRSSARTSGSEQEELAQIYVQRGLEPTLARQVAQQLMAKDAFTAHARDELGISEITTARPVQAAFTSAATFSVGAAMPLLMVLMSPAGALVLVVSVASLGFLALLGAIGARAGGANVLRATDSSDILGGFGDGTHCRYREGFRNSCLTIETSLMLCGMKVGIRVILCHVAFGGHLCTVPLGYFLWSLLPLWRTSAAAADARKGETLAKRRCATCHVVSADQ